MVIRGSVRRVFPGGNTSRGFVSFYEHIAPRSARYSFILKGGPGTGKSTFMKRIAADLLALGIDAEMHHCSADAESVDAVAFPAIGVALIDGTAPHTFEPEYYNVNGAVVDLGRFCNETTLQRHRDGIARVTEGARASFRRAYRYLAAARHVREDWDATNGAARDEGLLNEERTRLIGTLFANSSAAAPGVGRRRRLFASSITPDGPCNYVESWAGPLRRKFIVKGEPGTGRAALMNQIADAAVGRGYDVELYHCAFEPRDIDHVLIPALDTAVISSVPPHEYVVDNGDEPSVQLIDLNRCLQSDVSGAATPYIATARFTFWQLFRHAVSALKDAQRLHMQLESYYAPHVDFDSIEQLRQTIRDRILDMSGKEVVEQRTACHSL